MLSTLSAYIRQLSQFSVQSGVTSLEEYIMSHNPQTVEEVDALARCFDAVRSKRAFGY